MGRAPIRILYLFMPSTCLVLLSSIASTLMPTTAAGAQSVSIVPASRVENIDSPPSGLPDQQFQDVEFPTPLSRHW